MIQKNSKSIFAVFMTALMICLGSCDPARKFVKEENDQIQGYLSINSNLNFELKPSGLYYLEVTAGSGPQPVTHDTVYIKYTGRFLNGIILDTNIGKADTLKRALDEGYLIAGLDEGIKYMRSGGKSMFLMPSKLAYGSYGYYPYIPGYTPFIYDVELVQVKAGIAK